MCLAKRSFPTSVLRQEQEGVKTQEHDREKGGGNLQARLPDRTDQEPEDPTGYRNALQVLCPDGKRNNKV